MAKTIYKYPVELGIAEITMPVGAKVLCVQAQRNTPQIWAIVDPDSVDRCTRTFLTYGTGHQHEDIEGEYLGTFQLNDGEFVSHVFEL